MKHTNVCPEFSGNCTCTCLCVLEADEGGSITGQAYRKNIESGERN